MLAYDGDKVWYWVMTISPSVYKCQLYLLVKPMSSQLEAGRCLTVKLTRAAPSLFIIFMMALYNKVGMHKQYLRQILHKAFIDNNNNAAFILPFSFSSNSQSPSQNNNTFFFSCYCQLYVLSYRHMFVQGSVSQLFSFFTYFIIASCVGAIDYYNCC